MSSKIPNRKEIQRRIKKVFEKIMNLKKEKAVPQLILQPYRPQRKF